MKFNFKRLASSVLAIGMLASMSSISAFAADAGLANGDYKGTVHFHNASNPANYSMCDPIFAHEADVVLTDANAELTVYVAYPVPAFSDQGTDGTIKDVTITIGEDTCNGESDITTKAVKTFDTTGALFGINAGDELSTQAVKFTLPRSAVDSFEEGLDCSAFVNVVMNTTQNFVVKITNLQAASSGSDATETSTQSMEITAQVAVQPTYSVTVPASVALGELSTEQDTVKDISVQVSANNLTEGSYIEVSAEAEGKLPSEGNTISYTNSLGTQQASAESTLTGQITVKAADVANAAAGNYTGTANFTINYYAAA